jgi:hypothetical protein
MGPVPSLRPILLALSVTPLFAQHLVTVRSAAAQRSYTIDTDAADVQQAMRPASDSASASRVPSWLYPYAGADPSDSQFDAKTGLASATFSSGGTAAQAVAYYQEAFRAHNLKPAAGNDATIAASGISGAVAVRIEERSDSLRLRVTYTPARTTHHNYDDAGYDDTTRVLRLRDTSNGQEFELDLQTIAAHASKASGRAAAVPARTGRMPQWLSVYP